MAGIHEECGVFGAFAQTPENLAGLAYYGLYALQHRGQESCGIVLNDDGVFSVHKDLGTVENVFPEEVMKGFPSGNMVVGHVRYGTTGGTNRENCQPIVVNHQKGKLALAYIRQESVQADYLLNATELRRISLSAYRIRALTPPSDTQRSPVFRTAWAS